MCFRDLTRTERVSFGAGQTVMEKAAMKREKGSVRKKQLVLKPFSILSYVHTVTQTEMAK